MVLALTVFPDVYQVAMLRNFQLMSRECFLAVMNLSCYNQITMPIYEYKCKKCEKVFEEIHGANDKAPEKCRECGGDLKRIFSPVGIVFKGSGFHINDYGKSSKRDHSTSASSTTEKKSSGESKPSFESKPKTETKTAAETKASTETKSSAASEKIKK